MRDRGHELTDKLLEEMERKLRKEYRQAVKETEAKLEDYLRRFEIKDEIWRKNVADGKKTAQEYKQWRLGQIAVGKRWEQMRDTLAQDYHNANVRARSIMDGYKPQIYAENHNFGTYEAEMGAKLDTSYTLYNQEAAERIMRDNPDLLPPPGKKMSASIAAGKDIAWQEGQIQSVITQSILQGESISNMAKRIAQTMGETNHKSTIRYARTAATAAENAGKADAYARAQEMGIDMEQEWRAVLDMRTRHEHRQLDGQRRKVGEPFEVDGEEILYPGDPSAPGYLIWNCRCALRGIVAGLEPQARKHRSLEDIEGMSYEEWKESKVEKPHRITKQEEIAETMRRKYIREDYGNTKFTSGKEDGIIRNRERIGRPVVPTEKTLNMALDPQAFIDSVASKYNMNLRCAGKTIRLVYDDSIVQYGRVAKSQPDVIMIGRQAFVSEEEMANTIAHELNHSRSYLRGGDAPEETAYAAGEALASYIRGER